MPDSTDQKIMLELGVNCRTSYRAVAKKLGLSTTAVIKRINAMVDYGSIYKLVVLPSDAMIEATYFTALVHTYGNENSDDFIDQVGENPEVIQVSTLASTKGKSYFLTGQYVETERLEHIDEFLRGLSFVREFELHPNTRMRVYPGRKMALSDQHIATLRILNKNPRAQVKEIALGTGLPLKIARKTLRELEKGDAFRFTARSSRTREKSTSVVVKMEYDVEKATQQEIWDWLLSECEANVFDVFFSMKEPTAFVWFTGGSVHDSDGIFRGITNAPFAKSAHAMFILTHTKFPWLGEYWLDNLLREDSNAPAAKSSL
ncbi:MAG: Lrp/AsnC family transcriptional regulator [Candidatus Sifarchaeia archaeon]